MKLMEQFNIELRSYEMPEPGEYKLRLKAIEPITMTYKGEDYNKLRWTFETVGTVNSQGEPFRIYYTTAQEYTGGTKANLTKLIKGFFGRALTLEEFAELDTRHLTIREVGAIIEIAEKESGDYPNIILFKTLKKKKPAGTPPAESSSMTMTEARQENITENLEKSGEPEQEKEKAEADPEVTFEDVPF